MRVLLTGASSGIGHALARQLTARGDELVVLARDPERVSDVGAAGVLTADLSDPAALVDLEVPVELDAVVHCAGVVELGRVADTGAEAWREQLDVNLIGPALLTRACLPALRAARGTLVYVNSSAGLNANPDWSAYAASKFGLRALADAVRAEEADHGVRVTTVFPGRTATPMQQKVHEQEGKEYDPGRWISPEVVADTIRYVLDLPTGQTIPDVTVKPQAR